MASSGRVWRPVGTRARSRRWWPAGRARNEEKDAVGGRRRPPSPHRPVWSRGGASRTRGRTMLINCVVYQEARKLGDFPVEAIPEYLAQPRDFVWVALKDPAPEELTQMQEEFQVP